MLRWKHSRPPLCVFCLTHLPATSCERPSCMSLYRDHAPTKMMDRSTALFWSYKLQRAVPWSLYERVTPVLLVYNNTIRGGGRVVLTPLCALPTCSRPFSHSEASLRKLYYIRATLWVLRSNVQHTRIHRARCDQTVHYYQQLMTIMCWSFRPASVKDVAETGLLSACKHDKQEIRSVERESVQCCCIQYTAIEIFDCNCNDLKIGGFSVIQRQRSWCQSIAHGWFPIRLPLTPSS